MDGYGRKRWAGVAATLGLLALSGCAKQTALEGLFGGAPQTSEVLVPEEWVTGGDKTGRMVYVRMPENKDFAARRWDPATGQMVQEVTSNASVVYDAKGRIVLGAEQQRFDAQSQMFAQGLNMGLAIFDRVIGYQTLRGEQQMQAAPARQAAADARLDRLEGLVREVIGKLPGAAPATQPAGG